MFNQRLKSAIYIKVRSEARFAAHLGVTESLLSSVIQGLHQPSELLKRRICRRLEVPEEEIFQGSKN